MGQKIDFFLLYILKVYTFKYMLLNEGVHKVINVIADYLKWCTDTDFQSKKKVKSCF